MAVQRHVETPLVDREGFARDVLRQFFVDLQQTSDEYVETDELRWEGLQEA